MLATTANLKTRLGITDATDDTLLAAILAGVSAQMAIATGRVWRGAPCLEETTWDADTPLLLNVPHERTEWLWLPAWPLVSVGSVTESLDKDWDNEDALTEDDDYTVDYELGGIHKPYWLRGAQTVQVYAVGGYVAAGGEVGDGQVAIPADLAEAAYTQASYVYLHRGNVGVLSASAGGAAVSMAHAGLPLLDSVKTACDGYRRMI